MFNRTFTHSGWEKMFSEAKKERNVLRIHTHIHCSYLRSLVAKQLKRMDTYQRQLAEIFSRRMHNLHIPVDMELVNDA